MGPPEAVAPRRIRQRYDVVETVGRGGQGTVVKAIDIRHDRLVALKVRRVPADPLEAERALSETRTLLELPPHEGLPIARDDFFEGGEHVLVLDWVDGIDLGRLLATDGTPGLPLAAVLRWGAQAADALTHLHRHDPPIVHGDVKPANLVLDRRGHVVVVDFGVSSVPGRLQRGGTPGYRAPEVISGGAPSPATDVYGLAATLFALLAGEPPSGVLPTWDGLEPGRAARLEAALRRGLSTDPARRPATVGELVEAMHGAEDTGVPTGTVTVLLTEVVGSAELWETSPLAMPAAAARHDLIVDRVVERNDGRRTTGGIGGEQSASVFPRAAQAVRAAVALNHELVGATEPALRVRAGLHTGPVVGGEVHPPVVHRAAALRSLAEAGQVLLSATTAGLVASRGDDGVRVVSLGSHHLPGAGGDDEVFALSAAGLDVPPDPSLPPYPGLLPFSVDDADVYLGRDDAVATLRRLLAPGRVVVVLGPSGSGKSSLLRAGLLPHLPGATLCTPTTCLGGGLEAVADGVLVVDQVEELLAWPDEAAAQAFAQQLCEHPAGAVVALRADAFAGLARFPGLAEAVAAHHLLLAPMRPDQLRVAVEAPAALRGLTLEPGLVELVLADAGHEPGALPMVAHALRETWARRDGRTLRVHAYRAIGGVQGAIAATAEGVYAPLEEEDRAVLRALLLRMVQPGEGVPDSRRRVELDELRDLGAPATVDALVERLVAARLVTVDGSSVEPAHEALLRAWPRLAEWIDEQRDTLRRHRHLTAAAQAWTAGGRDDGELYRGARLDGAVELAGPFALTATEQRFLDASLAARREEERRSAATDRRLRRLLAAVGTALVVALIAGAVAVAQVRRVADERDRADAAGVEADTARLAAEARAAAATRPDLALLLALEAHRRGDTLETRSALLDALTAQPQLVGKLHGAESGLEAVAFSPDGTLLAAPTSDATGTRLWDATTLRPLGDPLATGEGFELDFAAAFTSDGATLAVVGVVEERGEAGPTSARAVLQSWDLPAGRWRATVELGLLPEEVVALDATHVVVAGAPLSEDAAGPAWQAATQVVDLDAGEAAPVEVVVDEPAAAALVGTTLVVLGADGTLLLAPLGVGDATSGTAVPLDASALLPDDDAPTAIGYDPVHGRLAIGLASGAVVLARVDAPAGGTRQVVEFGRVDLAGDIASAITFSPDGDLLAIGGFLASTQLLDAATGRMAAPPLGGLAGQVNDLAFSPDGSRLAAGDGDRTGAVWSLDGSRPVGRPVELHDDAVVATLVVPDGDLVITASFDGSFVARDPATEQERWRVEVGEPIWTAALEPDGERVALGGADGLVQVRIVADGRVAGEERVAGPVEGLAWSPAAPLLAVGTSSDDAGEHHLVFLHAETLQPSGRPVTTVGGSAIAVAFSPGGERIAVVLDNNLVRLADVATRALDPRFLESVDVPFSSVAWSPDGRVIATGTSAGTVQLWDAGTLERSAPPGQQSRYPVRGLGFRADGAVLASTTGFSTSQLWDVATGRPIGGELVAGALPITTATIPEGERPEIPFVPAFSADGLVLHAGGDHPVDWSVDPEMWRVAACTVAGRELTAAEWRRYLPGERSRRVCPS